MSDIVEQNYRYRKFCKIIGLHSIFSDFTKGDYTFYDTSSLDPNKITSEEFSRQLSNSESDNTLPITRYTVIFITADSTDEGNKIIISTGEVDENDNKIETTRTLSKLDTMLWVNGNIYSLSQKNVKTVFYNDNTDKLDIVYSDDNTESIDIAELQLSRKIAVNFPLCISQESDTDDTGKEEIYEFIRLFGQEKNDSGRNFVVGMYEDDENTPAEYKNTYNGHKYTTIIGKGNIASTNSQIILGDFNEIAGSKFIVCDGGFDAELQTYVRKNLFTISDVGTVQALKDFVLSTETNKITHKLSDIHSVTVDDWYKETYK